MKNMTQHVIILLTVLVGFAHGFDFADFVDDLHSDLAPLLTLFGEKVAMQYISQAVSYLDCVVLALAPLGIITIMVSAIRVGGPTVLKAIVGRAKENMAAAELELMSSTSREVCELYNGENIVRCLGSGSVWQYICLYRKGPGSDQVKFMTLQQAIKKGLLIQTEGIASCGSKIDKARRTLARLIGTTTTKPEAGTPSPQDQTPEGEAITTTTAHAARQTMLQKIWRRFCRFVRQESFTSQPNETNLELGVYHATQQTQQRPKTTDGGSPEQDSNIPATTPNETNPEPGVPHATQQTEQHPKTTNGGSPEQDPGGPAKLIIIYDAVPEAPNISLSLQRLGDQTWIWVAVLVGILLQATVLAFFCLIKYNPKVQTFLKIDKPQSPYGFPMAFGGTVIMAIGMFLCTLVVERSTVEEVYKVDDQFDMNLYWLQQDQTVNGQVFQSYATFPDRCIPLFWKSHRERKSRREGKSQNDQVDKALKITTCFGVGFGLVGFVAQFIGFRGMHAAAPLAQLVAVLIMTVCRAVIRPGFTKHFGNVELLHGFEQVWLAQKLNQQLAQQVPQSMEDDDKKRQWLNSWSIVTGRDADYRAFETLDQSKKSQAPNSEAQRLLVMRRDLCELAKFRTVSSKCAAKIATAMEKALGILFPNGPVSEGALGFRWFIDVSMKGVTQPVSIDLSFEKRAWRVAADDLHAALSLWMYTARVQENGPRPDDKKKDSGHVEAKDGAWICRDVCEPSLKALGCRNYRRRYQVMKDLEMWTTQSHHVLAKIMERWEEEEKEEEKKKKEEEEKKREEEEKKEEDEKKKKQEEGNRRLEANCARAATKVADSQDSFVGLYASDILFSFMWSMAKTFESPSGARS